MKYKLFIGPLPPPMHGQSKCFQILVNNVSDSKIIDRNVTDYSVRKKWLKYSKALISSITFILFSSPSSVYISISRNWPGLMFDSIVILLSKLKGAKVVLHLHGNDFLISKFQRTLFSPVHSLCDTFITLSPGMERQVSNLLDCDIQTIVNPIDRRFIGHRAHHKNASLQVVFFSNLMESKGILDFIQLAEYNKESNIEFHVIGKALDDHIASAEKTFTSVISADKRLDNLTFHGALYGQDLPILLSKMDVLLFPSFYPVEGLPLSILECASLGVYPVINDHNDLSSFNELLDYCTITDTKDVKSVSDFLSKLLMDDLLQKGNANAMRCLAYSETNHRNSIFSLLDS